MSPPLLPPSPPTSPAPRALPPDPIGPLPLALIFFALALAIFGSGLGIAFYSDDFQFAFPEPGAHVFYYFTHPNPTNDFYRPLQAMVMAALQALFGLDPRPLHLLQILLHGGLGLLTFALGGRLGLPLPHRLLAGLFVLISQSTALAVLSNDTLAQVMGTLAGLGALYTLDKALEKGGFDIPWIWTSVGLLGVALFSKETSVGFCLLIAALGAWRIFGAWGAGLKKGLAGLALLGVPYLMVTGGYLLARGAVVVSRASLGDARYQFGLGLNIPKNIALLGGAVLSPVSTVTTFLAAKTGAWAGLALIALFAGLFVGAIAFGLWRVRQPGLTLALAVATLLAMIPAVFLNHVSEAYSYNCLPFMALLIGMGAGESALGERPGRKVLGAILLAAAIANLWGLQGKARDMGICGAQATAITEALVAEGARIPQAGTLLLVSFPSPYRPAYSVFLIDDVKVLRFAEPYLRRVLGRPDLDIQIVNRDQVDALGCSGVCVAYAWRNDPAQLIPFPLPHQP